MQVGQHLFAAHPGFEIEQEPDRRTGEDDFTAVSFSWHHFVELGVFPDHLDILYELANGAQVHMRFSETTGLSAGNQTWIHGSEGTIYVDRRNTVMTGRRGDAELMEVPVKQIRASGGGSKSALWRQIQADVYNAPLALTNSEEGGAFGVALLGIYVLVVAQFKDFRIPLVILTPIPLTLIGAGMAIFAYSSWLTASIA